MRFSLQYRTKLLVVIATIAFTLQPAIGQLASAQNPGASQPKLAEFEVVAIRPSGPKDLDIGLSNFPGGRMVGHNLTLKLLIMYAYGVQLWQIGGGADWTGTDRFSLEAKPPLDSEASKLNPPSFKTPPSEKQRLMLQSMLADRFQLKTHHETREGPVYILTRGDKPLALKPPKDPNEYHWAGGVEGGMVYRGTGIAGTNISMPELATRLSGFLHRPVIDHTAIAGNYDFEYRTGDDSPDTDVTYAITVSLKELGLKLTPGKGPVGTIIIDSADKPSPN